MSEAGYSPYVLFRRGTTTVDALAGLVPTRTWSLLDMAADLAERRTGLAPAVGAALYDAVPLVPDAFRRAVLTLRRNVHTGRSVDLAATLAALPESCRRLLVEWVDLREAEQRLRTEAHEVLDAELGYGRKTLAEVAGQENFQRGVQLSGTQVFRELRAFLAEPDGTGGKPSRRRRIESTLVSFAYRVAYKPSPFGSFTEIGAHAWAPSGQPDDRPRTVRRTRLNIGLLAWMTHQLHRLPDADAVLTIRLNNTLTADGGRIRALTRAMEGTDDPYGSDRLVRAKHTSLVTMLRRVLGAGQLTELQLRAHLVDAGLAPDAAADTIDRLVRAGLCHRGIGLPDQSTGQAGVVARRLAALPGPAAAACAQVFARLQRIEDDFAAAGASRRAELLEELTEQVERFAATLGLAPPGPEVLRAAMYEEVGTTGTSTGWRPDVLERNAGRLALLQRVTQLLDDAAVEQLGLYRFYADRHGGSGADLDLIDFYAEFAALTPMAASAVMLGTDDPATGELRAIRRTLADWLLDQASGAAEVRLTEPWLRTYVESLPAWAAPPRPAAFRVQFAGDRAVINGVTSGQGVFFSRFCDLLDTGGAGEWKLGDEIRRHLAQHHPRQADLTVTLGLNFNLHPRLAPLELVYPGSVPEPGHPTLSLGDLAVRPDPVRRRLTLVSRRDGQPIDLVPMNFLYPAAAPRLYRFLCAFAPGRTFHGGLWEQVARARPDGRRPVLPRLLLGDVVLDRLTWRIPVDDVPELAGLERQEVTALAAFDRWRRATGLPRHTFFRIFAGSAPAGGSDWIEQTRQWAAEARSARLHKPHFLDARDPFLLHILAKQARLAGSATLVFQECLPGAGSGPYRAEEFFIELNPDGGDHE